MSSDCPLSPRLFPTFPKRLWLAWEANLSAWTVTKSAADKFPVLCHPSQSPAPEEGSEAGILPKGSSCKTVLRGLAENIVAQRGFSSRSWQNILPFELTDPLSPEDIASWICFTETNDKNQ